LEAATGNVLVTLQHQGPVRSVAFSPDGKRIVTGSFDGTARVWDVGNGQQLFPLTGHSDAIRSVAFFPDGKRIVTGSFDRTAKVWEIASRKEIYKLEGHTAEIFSVAVSPDGQWIATGSWDNTVRVWHAATGQHSLTFSDHRVQVFPVVFSPDSRRIGSAGGDGTVKVRETTSGKELLTFRDKEKIWSAAFSGDGRRLVTGSLGLTATVWDAASGKAQLTLKGHTLHIFSAAFSPDGHRIVTGSADQTAKLWDAATGKELLTFRGHRGSIFSVAFSPDGQRIVTASRDHTIKVWEAASKEQVARWQKEEQGHADDLAAKQRQRAAAAAAAVESARALRANMPGAIKQWLILSPIAFDGRDGARALREQQVAQESQLRPRAGEQAKAGQSELVWRGIQSEDYLIDFNRLVGAPTHWSVAYAVCYIQSEAAQSGVLLKVGSDDQAKVYLNGKLIYESTSPRVYPLDEDTEAGALKAGLNVLVFKVVNETEDWKGSVRLTDAAGQPVKGTRVVLTPP
jgi:dipeptidyl aminopeptidase/acylaminoacyl peptidase